MKLLEQYTDGPSQLGSVIAGFSDEQLDAVPIPGKWSIRQVVCHIADFELVYADRMKRVIAVTHPPSSVATRTHLPRDWHMNNVTSTRNSG